MTPSPVRIVVLHQDDASSTCKTVESILSTSSHSITLLTPNDSPIPLPQDPRITTHRFSATSTIAGWNLGLGLFPEHDIIRVEPGTLFFHSGWVENLLHAGAAPSVGIVGGKTFFPEKKGGNLEVCSFGRAPISIFGTRAGHANRAWNEFDIGQLGEIQEVDSVAGSVVLLKRAMLRICGGYDDQFQSGDRPPLWIEQDDLCLTAALHGFATVVTPHCCVFLDRDVSNITPAADIRTSPFFDRWQTKWKWNPLLPDLRVIRNEWPEAPWARRFGKSLLDSWGEAPPPVDIILPTRNRVRELRAFFESLATTDYPSFKVYVANNGSTDETQGYLDSVKSSFPFPIHPVHFPVNIGIASALNWLVSISSSPLVARLDDENSMPSHWLTTLVSTLRRNPYAGVVGTKINATQEPDLILNADGRLYPTAQCHSGERDKGQYDYVSRVSMVLGSCVLYRRKALEIAGPFENAFGAYTMDDLDHPLAIRAAGYDVLYDGRVTVHHPNKQSLKRTLAYIQHSFPKLFAKWGSDVFEIIESALDQEGRRLEAL